MYTAVSTVPGATPGQYEYAKLSSVEPLWSDVIAYG
jgi:hypothetical protein